MTIKIKLIAATMLLIVMIVLISGCFFDDKSPDAAAAGPDPGTAFNVTPADAANETVSHHPIPSSTSGKLSHQPATEDTHSDSSDRNNAGNGDQNTTKETTKTSPTTKTEQEQAANLPTYSAKHPVLMGLRIGDSLDTVIKRYGEPDSQFQMYSPDQPIQVVQYAGFSVGISSDGLIVFIDVSSGKVNPGLNGAHIGSTADEVMTALGQPAARSEYVIRYQGASVMLKLDLDPKSGKVTSIKLFASP